MEEISDEAVGIPRREVNRWAAAFVAMAVVWALVVLVSSWRKSPTFDEVPHIGAGLTYWKFHDFRMNPEHPQLIKALSVLPVMVLDKVPVTFETSDYYVSSWFESKQDLYGFFLLFRNRVNPQLVIFHARMVPVAIGVLGGFLAFWWGRRLGRSVAAGVASGGLLLLYPEYAGHARFVTFDVPTLAACGGLSAVALCWWRRPGWRQVMGFAAVAAVGSLVKLPVTVFCVLMLVTLFVLVIAARGRIGFRRYLMLVAATMVAGYFAAWAAAGFRFGLTNPELQIATRSYYAPLDGNYGDDLLGRVLGFFWAYRLLPETTLATIQCIRSFEVRHYYFMGDWRLKGWYSYFFATFLLKTSLVMVGVYLAAILTWIWKLWRMSGVRRRYEAGRLVLLLLPFLLLFCVFVLGRASLGHRYILFVYFPLSVLTGAAMVRWWIRRRAGRVLSICAVVYGVAVFAWQYPHYETYFNEIVRTPYRGTKYLADSNVDWGQDFPLLGDELRRRGIQRVNLAFFGAGRPSAYGVNSYNWILPNYPYATFRLEEAAAPEEGLYTAMSMHAYFSAKQVWRGVFDRDPVWVENSVLLFAPEEGDGF